jgi:hypothetical protein
MVRRQSATTNRLEGEQFVDPVTGKQFRPVKTAAIRRMSQRRQSASTRQLIGNAPVSRSDALRDSKRLHAGLTYSYTPHQSSPTDLATGLLRSLRIPVAGVYRIEAAGASAAGARTNMGGKGAQIAATFHLQQGEILEILCGAMPVPPKLKASGSGGGGGTFISINGRRLPLMVAGGGGGTADITDGADGRDAVFTEEGGNGVFGSSRRFAAAGAGGQEGKGGMGMPENITGGGGDTTAQASKGSCRMTRL